MRVFTVAAVAAILTSGAGGQAPAIPGAADRAADVLAAARTALGGEAKLAAIKSIRAEGPFRRVSGQRETDGTLTLVVVTPDRFRRSEDVQTAGLTGPLTERVTTFNGTEAWDDMQTYGGGGGGRGFGFGMGQGAPPADGAGGARGPASEEQMAQARARRAKLELQRYLIALLADPSQTWTDAGIAESPDGKADMLETRDASDRPVRLFIDQQTHLPLMVQYEEVRPQAMMGGARGPRGGAGAPGAPGAPSASGADGRQGAGGQPPTPEQRQARIEQMRRNPPKPSTVAMHLADYKRVDGVMLPHRIDTSVDGKTSEEWTIEKFKLNPSVKASDFEKPKDK